ncbi:hypothetical protein WN943_028046 [Citrus x changshan-huyou]
MKGKNGKSKVASGEQKQRGQCRNHTGEREADRPPKDRVAFDSKSSFSLVPPPGHLDLPRNTAASSPHVGG